jgi:lipid-A-disaccharide synthase
MTAAAPRVAMVAGEASGDLLAGALLQGFRHRWPAMAAMGIGGPRMGEQGFDAWWPHDKLAVRGYVEVIRHYRELLGIRNALARRLLDERPDVFVGVDAPDFNLGLETRLKSAGIRTVHFVSPSIWAWRGGRIHRIGAAVHHMLCIFPFEPALYERAGIPATYVGHPLAASIPLDPDRAAARAALGLPAGAPVVALLPGSRRSEVQHLAEPFVQAALLMRKARPDLRFVLPVVPGLRAMVEAALASAGAGGHRESGIELLDGRSHEALAACDATLIASGTATLEAALFKRPMVIAYKMNAISWQILKRMNYQPWVGLPNILLERFSVPELLQSDATPQALAEQTLAWLDDRARCDRLCAEFTDLHHRLKRDTARLATDAVASVIGG